MSGMESFLPYIATAITVMGDLNSGKAAKNAGRAQQQAAEYQAQQLEVNAGTALAVGQREALEQQRQGELVQSRAIALVSMYGNTSDPGVVSLLATNAGETAYKANVAIYGGEDRARALRMQAAAERYSGGADYQAGLDRQTSYETKAFGDIIGSQAVTSLATRFGTKPEQLPAPVSDAHITRYG